MILSSLLSPALGLSGPVLSQNSAGGAPPPPTNTNLLFWSEQFQQAIWAKGGTMAITPDAQASPSPPGDGSATADLLTGTSGDVMTQNTIASATGSAVETASTLLPTGSFNRVAISGVFDSLDYSLSVYGRAVSGFVRIRLRLEIVGGLLQIQIVLTTAGTGCWIWGAQLEQAAIPTAYVKREGV